MRIKTEVIHTIEIDRSCFICYLNRCFDELQARDYIASIKKMHPDAHHHCTAFIVNKQMTQRTNDDGEPSKTAGRPMLEVLLKNELEDVCAIVVRYFGGIKLGAGGLIRAYSKSISEALSVASFTTPTLMQQYELHFSYDFIDKLEYLLKDTTILDKSYAEVVTYTFLSNDLTVVDAIIELTKGQYLPQLIDQVLVEFDLDTKTC